MRKLRILAISWSIAALAVGATWAQDPTYPSGPDYGDAFELPDISGEFNPMAVSTQDVAYDGNGSVDIPFTINQRATVWVVIYRKGSGETGERGPAGAWLRLEPQDLYIATTPGQVAESGDGTVTWDGNDWEGNAAGAGDYEFDVVAVNNLDKPVLAGPGAGPSGFTAPNIDTSQDPPEIWVQEYEREVPDRGHKAGDMVRGTLGTDYLANPNAWERWNFDFGFEGARTFGGMRIDDQDREIFWTSNHSGENLADSTKSALTAPLNLGTESPTSAPMAVRPMPTATASSNFSPKAMWCSTPSGAGKRCPLTPLNYATRPLAKSPKHSI